MDIGNCCLDGLAPLFLLKSDRSALCWKLKSGSYDLISLYVSPTSMSRFPESHCFLLFPLLVAWFLGKEMGHHLRNPTRPLLIRFANIMTHGFVVHCLKYMAFCNIFSSLFLSKCRLLTGQHRLTSSSLETMFSHNGSLIA